MSTISEHFKLIPNWDPDNFEIKPFDHQRFLVTDLRNKRNFLVDENTVTLLSLIDNKRSLEEITRKFNIEQNTDLSDQAIYTVILNDLSNFITIPNVSIQKAIHFSVPSYLQFPITLVTEKRIQGLAQYLSKILFPQSPIFYFIMLVAGFLIVLYHLKYWGIAEVSITISQLPFLFILLILNDLFHEIGHATACARFGIYPGRIGFGFYLMLPVFFADVSQAWRLNRWKRIIVNLSGIYFELIFCLLILGILSLTRNFNLITVPVILFIKTIFNLNPFFRTDGYWVLSDAFNIPNLRKVSNEALMKCLYSSFTHKKISISFNEFLLSCYSLITVIFISTYTGMVLWFYSYQVFNFFPIYSPFLKELFFGSGEIKLRIVFEIMIVLSFYFLFLFYLWYLIKRIKFR
jgi:putative peptide zinc metalloprotease protein